jgi:Concanavalin A-like lectin/glucanases superfamily
MKTLFNFNNLVAGFATALATQSFAQDFGGSLLVDLPLATDATDISGNGYNGTVLGGTFISDPTAPVPGAIHFPGNISQGVAIPATNSLDQGYVTVAAWIRPEVSFQTMQLAYKGNVWNSTDAQWSLYISGNFFTPANDIVFAVARNGGNVPGQGVYYYYSSAVIPVNQWTHVVATWNGTNGSVFLNGLPTSVGTYPHAPAPGPLDHNAGGELSVGRAAIENQLYTGSIADFRLYNRALTTNEVAELFAAGGGQTPRRPATANATVVNGFVTSVQVTDPGIGYYGPPLIAFPGGGGLGATATVQLSNGSVIGINLINAGSGYTNAPTVVIDPPAKFPLGTRLASATGTVDHGFLVDAQVIDGGAGFTNPPAVTVVGGGGSGASVSASVARGRVIGLKVNSAGSGYTGTPSIVIAPPGPIGADAVAVIQNGALSAINIAYSGSGYTVPPPVSLIGGGGTGASAAAVVTNGVVVGVNITNPGSGYNSAPFVRIDPPASIIPPPTSLSVAVSSLAIIANAVAGHVYALESSTDLKNWNQV